MNKLNSTASESAQVSHEYSQTTDCSSINDQYQTIIQNMCFDS